MSEFSDSDSYESSGEITSESSSEITSESSGEITSESSGEITSESSGEIASESSGEIASGSINEIFDEFSSISKLGEIEEGMDVHSFDGTKENDSIAMLGGKADGVEGIMVENDAKDTYGLGIDKEADIKNTIEPYEYWEILTDNKEVGKELHAVRGATELSEGYAMQERDQSIDLIRTEPGYNQILHVIPGQESAEQMVRAEYLASVKEVLALHESQMSKEQLDRIKDGIGELQVVGYQRDTRAIGSYSNRGNHDVITIANKNGSQIEGTTVHEVNHFCSHNKTVEKQTRSGAIVTSESGVRQFSFFKDVDGTTMKIEDRNRALNEGITCLYSNRQLEERSEGLGQRLSRQNSYSQVTEVSERIEEVVGRESMEKAYYGGDCKGLETRINEVACDKNAFSQLSQNMDIMQYGWDPIDRYMAMQEVECMLKDMMEKRN